MRLSPKLLKHAICCILLVLASTAEGQKTWADFPTYEEVLERVFGKYELEEEMETYELRFEKRKTGWYVMRIQYAEGRTVSLEECLWDSRKKKYLRQDFEKRRGHGSVILLVEGFLKKWDAEYFDLSPYFGYPGWEIDVINDCKERPDLTPDEQYALGRAYSSQAANLLPFKNIPYPGGPTFSLPQGANSLTSAQLAEYRGYARSAVQTFEELARLHPDYEVGVGTIAIKAANERMSTYLDLAIFQNLTEARKELLPDVYPQSMVTAASNVLGLLPEHSVLFTQGDNDTFPLLYLQSQGFRTDVTVVNANLLNAHRYVAFIRRGGGSARGVGTSLPPEIIRGAEDLAFGMRDAPDSQVHVFDFLEGIEETVAHSFGQPRALVPCPARKVLLENKAYSVHCEFVGSAAFLYNVVCLAMVSGVLGERPVYFSAFATSETRMGLDAFLLNEGLVDRLQPWVDGQADADAIVEARTLWKDKLLYQTDWGCVQGGGEDARVNRRQYRRSFYFLASDFQTLGHNDIAVEILNECCAVLPIQEELFSAELAAITRRYFELEQPEKALELAHAILAELQRYQAGQVLEDTVLSESIEDAYGWLVQVAKDFDQVDLCRQLEEMSGR